MPIQRDTMCMCGPDTDRNSDYKEPHRTIRVMKMSILF